MKKRRLWSNLLLLIFIFTIPVILNAQSSRSDLELQYMKAVNAYMDKNHAQSLATFKSIQETDPTFRATQVKKYIRLAETQLNKTGLKEVFKPAEEKTVEVEVSKEGELEAYVMTAQRLLLDAYAYVQDMEKKHQIPSFEMTAPQSTLTMAKKAYEQKQYTETIRLANQARLQVDQIIQGEYEGEKPLLGEIGKSLVTLNLNNAPLEQTLKQIYDITGVNIIVFKGVGGKVTVNIKDEPLQKALDLICEANGLKYIEEDGAIKIMTREEYNTRDKALQETNRRVFNVYYGDAALITKALRETFQLENIVHDPRTNSIIADVYNPALLQQIQNVISSLDMPISQVLIEAKIIEVVLSKANTFSIDWLISSKMISALDTTLTGPRYGATPTFTPGVTSTLPSGDFAFGLTNSDVNSLITALASQGEVKLVQAPKIMCLNGTTAIIRVVQNYPYIIPEYTRTTGTSSEVTDTTGSFTVQEEEVGTEFEVTPIIQRNRTIFLSMNIFDSRLVKMEELSAVAAGEAYETQYPIISKRETTQNVTLFDGQTLVIGGMIQHREEVTESGVPFLRRIPLLGYLFKKPAYAKSTSELVMFLTPYIVTTYQEAESVSMPDRQKTDREINAGILEKF
ncbi:MAG: hypothetical protein ACOX1Z_00470 [Candidatus Ratteibacteria bacterium]